MRIQFEFEFTCEQMRVEAERLLRINKRAYPAQVGKHGRSSEIIARRLAVQQSIVNLLREMEKSENLI